MRKNGFSRPFHPYQVIAWGINAGNVLMLFVIILPRIYFSISNSILFAFTAVSIGILVHVGISMTKVNPQIDFMSEEEA